MCLQHEDPTLSIDMPEDGVQGQVEFAARKVCVTSIVVSHDVRGSFRVADKLALLKNGKIVATGTPDELKDSDNLDVREFLERDFGTSTMTEQ